MPFLCFRIKLCRYTSQTIITSPKKFHPGKYNQISFVWKAGPASQLQKNTLIMFIFLLRSSTIISINSTALLKEYPSFRLTDPSPQFLTIENSVKHGTGNEKIINLPSPLGSNQQSVIASIQSDSGGDTSKMSAVQLLANVLSVSGSKSKMKIVKECTSAVKYRCRPQIDATRGRRCRAKLTVRCPCPMTAAIDSENRQSPSLL